MKLNPRKETKKEKYEPFGFFKANKIPERACYGYEDQKNAGKAMCSEVLEGKAMLLLVFGFPRTGKTLFPCRLANLVNGISEQKFSLAYIQTSSYFLFEDMAWRKKLCKFNEKLYGEGPLIIHLVELDNISETFLTQAIKQNGDISSAKSFFMRFLNGLFSDSPKKSLIIATSSYPQNIASFLLSRFDNVFYIEPTGKKEIEEMIRSNLNRNDSERITKELLAYFQGTGMTPLGRDVIHACDLLLRRPPKVDDLEPEEIAKWLKRFISPFPDELISQYREENKLLIEKSAHHIDYWLKSIEAT